MYVYIISWCPDDVYRLRMTFLENKSLFFGRRFASRRDSAPLFVAFSLSHPRRKDGKNRGRGVFVWGGGKGGVKEGGNVSNLGRKEL